MVRVVVTCGLAGAIIGAGAQGIDSYFGNGEVLSGKKASAPTYAKDGKAQVGWKMLSGAFAGFLGGALVVGLSAAFILTMIKSARWSAARQCEPIHRRFRLL